jgi:hypothetical protein
MDKKVDAPLDAFLKSESFKNLNVSIDELGISSSQIKDVGEDIISILIPFKDKDELRYVVGYIKNYNTPAQEFVLGLIFKFNSEITYNELSKAIENKIYNGEIEISTGKATLRLNVIDSKFKEAELKTSSSSRSTACGTVGSDAWVYNVNKCVDDRWNAMNTFDYAICMITIAECYVQTVISCLYDGCLASVSPA